MNSLFVILTAVIGIVTSVKAGDHLPATLMTTRGKMLASEDFAKPPAPLEGKPIGFATGFTGWRYNGSSTATKSGRWEVVDGTFRGIEGLESHHPATASFGIQFKNAIIQVDVRLNDVPAEGRQYRSIFVKTTDAKDYVTALMVGPGVVSGVPYDPQRINPATKQRDKNPAARAPVQLKLDEWYTVVVEILGDEMVGSVHGTAITFRNPLVANDKHSVMLGVSTEASFRNFRIWEALPNPEWEKTRATIPAPKP